MTRWHHRQEHGAAGLQLYTQSILVVPFRLGRMLCRGDQDSGNVPALVSSHRIVAFRMAETRAANFCSSVFEGQRQL